MVGTDLVVVKKSKMSSLHLESVAISPTLQAVSRRYADLAFLATALFLKFILKLYWVSSMLCRVVKCPERLSRTMQSSGM
jgi:hypothetical protein